MKDPRRLHCYELANTICLDIERRQADCRRRTPRFDSLFVDVWTVEAVPGRETRTRICRSGRAAVVSSCPDRGSRRRQVESSELSLHLWAQDRLTSRFVCTLAMLISPISTFCIRKLCPRLYSSCPFWTIRCWCTRRTIHCTIS